MAPSSSEAAQLRAAEGGGASTSDPAHLLSLELQQLLLDAAVDYDAPAAAAVGEFLHTLRAALVALPARAGVSKTPAGLRLHGRANVPVSLDFKPPSADGVHVVGSFILRTMCRPRPSVDVAVDMPAECFQPRDLKNYVYADKRQLYLAVLAKGLRRANLPAVAAINVQALAQDVDKPVLLLSLRGAAKRFSVRILPSLPQGTFKPSLLDPGHNNVRRRFLEAQPQPATPIYNSSILADMEVTQLSKAFHAALADCPSAVPGIVLLKKFLRNRGLSRRPDGFSGFLITAIVVRLVKTMVVTSAMAPHQVVRSVLRFLARTDLRSSAATALSLAPGGEGRGALAHFAANFDCVIVGPEGRLNLAARVTESACVELRTVATQALVDIGAMRPRSTSTSSAVVQSVVSASSGAATGAGAGAGPVADLNLTGDDSDEDTATAAAKKASAAAYHPPVSLADLLATFEHRTPPGVAFDRLICVQLPADVPADDAVSQAHALKNRNALCDIPWPRILERRAYHLLTKALGDRATLVRPLAVVNAGTGGAGAAAGAGDDSKPAHDVWGWPECVWWALDAPPPTSRSMWIGVTLDPLTGDRIADRGPPADRKADAIAFRAFWGDKSELHRFPDGSILETVRWALPPATQSTVVHAIVAHVLRRHMNLDADAAVVSPWSTCERVLELPHVLTAAAAGDAHSDAVAPATLRAIKAFDELATALRRLPGVPLRVTDVQVTSPELRYTSVFPPQPHPLAAGSFKHVPKHDRRSVSRVVAPLGVVVSLERSMKWPDDLDAIRATKTAFLLKMKYSLSAHHRVHSTATRSYLDVSFKGFVFRMRLYHPRELTLLERLSKRSTSKFLGMAGTTVTLAPAAAALVNVSATAATKSTVATAPHSGHEPPVVLPPARAAAQAADLRMECVLKPRHAALVRMLQAQRPAYGGAVRLARRWLAAHMFGDHLRTEAVELLVARVFLHPAPFQPPATPVVGFLRFLRLVASWDWAATPMLVNLGASATPVDVRTLQSRFDVVRRPGRAASPPAVTGPAMYLVSPLHRGKWSPAFTQSSPSAVVLRRLMVLAAASEGCILSWLSAYPPAARAPLAPRPGAAPLPRTAPSWTRAFVPTNPAAEFHALVRLHVSSVPRCDGRWFGPVVPFAVDDLLDAANPDAPRTLPSAGRFTFTSGKATPMALMPGFDPLALFAAAVRAAHRKQVMLFWNPLRPRSVGVVFRGSCAGPDAVDARVRVLEDILALGDGLAKDARLTPTA